MSEGKNRDEQFKGYARALAQEILLEMKYSVGRTSQDREKGLEELIARRAYDLVAHALPYISPPVSASIWYSGPPNLLHASIQKAMERISDLAELPKEQE